MKIGLGNNLMLDLGLQRQQCTRLQVLLVLEVRPGPKDAVSRKAQYGDRLHSLMLRQAGISLQFNLDHPSMCVIKDLGGLLVSALGYRPVGQ